MHYLVIVILIIVLGIIALIFSYIATYNKLQKNLIRIQEAEAEIDETLRKKYDLLVEMENVINNATDLKQDNFSELKSDNLKISNFDMDRRLSKVNETFKNIKSDYESKLDNETFNNLLIDLKINEEKNTAAKTYYNKFTTSLNLLINKFPSNLIARIHGIKERLYFDNKNMKDDDILDFKL